MYMYVHMHMYMYTHVCMCVYVYIYIYTYVHSCLHQLASRIQVEVVSAPVQGLSENVERCRSRS